MANQKLMKKVAPVVLSAAVALTSMPATAFAAEFSDTEVAVATEESADTEDVDIDAADAADVDIAEDAEDTDVDVEEAEGTTEDETSSEDLFGAEVNEDEFTAEAGEEQTSGEAYVLMNIPYDDFYKAELKNNDVKVDAFTSATLNKSRTSGMMNGNSAYRVDPNGTDVTGVTFPVKVSDISVLKDQKKVTDDDTVTITVTKRGQTSSETYAGKDSLIENASYSYYVLAEAPSYYKELTVNEDGSFAFSDVKGATEKTVETTAELKPQSKYGDYQLDINKEDFSSLIDADKDKIYGATVNTTDGTEYGMRHLENIWKGYKLAWCTGYTTSVHNCPTSSEHYKSMMGKTIDSVTYYTDKGIITFDINDVEVQKKTDVNEDYKYVYAGLTWAQYWAAEGVYAAGNAASSADKDTKGETDLGAFDTVTRATTNHGLHRGSYQTTAVIEGEKGSYSVSYWEGRNTVVFTDGSKATYNRGTLTLADGTTDEMVDYKVTGLKYVPVKVKAEDYEAFKKEYAVVENDGTLAGGYGEVNLKSYSLTADVTANTNGLKTATKNEDGSFSFSARANGTDSGIKNSGLKKAEGINVTVKDASGSYGEFLRVDLNGNYGDLGGAMQAVKWTYYGNDSTYTKALQTYGTKFAADNWMHKSMGIQLGLTKSLRCQLPEGYDGTGYWTLTVYALGYEDYTVQFQATDANIVKPVTVKPDTTKLEAVMAEAKALKAADYTAASWEKVANELEECEEMIKNIDKQTQNGVDEQIGHLREAIDSLVKITLSVNPTSGTLYVGGTAKVAANTNISGNVTWTSSNTGVATVANGVVTAKKAGTATITASISGKTATYRITVKNRGITAKVSQVYVGKKAKVKVTLDGVSGKAKFKTSNKKVATVNSKGVITGKKAGTAKITVTVGKYKKVLTVKVKKPSFKLVKSSAKLKKGKKTTIKVKAAPVSKVTYKSSNKKVATVNSKGVVTAKKKGTAKITVKCNGITKTFKVTVK